MGVHHIARRAEKNIHRGRKYVEMRGDMGIWERTIKRIILEIIITRRKVIRIGLSKRLIQIRITMDIKISTETTEVITEGITEVIIEVEVHIISTTILITGQTMQKDTGTKIIIIRDHMVIITA